MGPNPFFISESKETSYTCFENLYHLPINLVYCRGPGGSMS